MSDDIVAMQERLALLEEEVQMHRQLAADVDAGMNRLRDAGMAADRRMMEVSMFFAYVLETKLGGRIRMDAESMEAWADDRESRVVILLEKDEAKRDYVARTATRAEAQRVAGEGV